METENLKKSQKKKTFFSCKCDSVGVLKRRPLKNN